MKMRATGKDLVISVLEITGNPVCVSSSDGQKVYDRIAEAMKSGGNVELSFNNITMLTSAFLNAAIGQLYGTFSEQEIHNSFSIVDMQIDDLELLKRVIETAKLYFSDPKRFDQAIRDASEGHDNV